MSLKKCTSDAVTANAYAASTRTLQKACCVTNHYKMTLDLKSQEACLNTFVSFRKLLRALITAKESWGNFSRTAIACDWEMTSLSFSNWLICQNNSKFEILKNTLECMHISWWHHVQLIVNFHSSWSDYCQKPLSIIYRILTER